MRFRIPKELSESQKLFKVGPVALDRRQGAIVLGTFLGYGLAYKQLTKVVDLNSAQAMALFAPLVIVAMLLAFVRHEGRHLDWWIMKKASNSMKPKKLLWRRAPKNQPHLRDSVQAAMPAEKLFWEMVRTSDGQYVMVFEIEPVSLSLSGPDEQQRVWAATAQLYNRLDFPIVEITRSKRGNTEDYAQNLKEAIAASVSPGEIRLAEYARRYLSFLERIVPLYNVYDRKSYIVLPYRPPNPDLKSRKKKRAATKEALRLQNEAEDAYRVLLGRAQTIFNAVTTVGARVRLLTDIELLAFMKDEATGEEQASRKTPALWEPVTMEVGGFKRLSDERRKKMVQVIKKQRKNAPPAVGIGDLTLADKISPDAVRIHPDYLRIGDRYHATLFVSEYPPDVGFGELQQILHIPGRVKVVKYIKPMAQEKAVAALGNRVAELVAAEATASDGNVIATNQRAVARYSAESAMSKLMSAEESFFNITLLVHCEAESRNELQDLTESVRTKISGIRGEARLAREEAWEGYVSALPLARNLLAKRYCSKGMLTHAMACLFTFGSYEISHPSGILYGVNPYSGALIAIDNRELMNPHMIVLGTSGGGKTMTIKALSTRHRMRNHRVVIIDPVGDSGYGPVAREIGGQYVVFGQGAHHKFNPCAIDENYMDLARLAAAEHEEDAEEARNKARAAALDGKILKLTRLVSLMVSGSDAGEGLTGREQALVERLWYAVYAQKGITRDPETHALTPPTFKDFFHHLAEEPGLAELRENLYPWEQGALSEIFDGQTNVDLDNKYLVLQIAGLEGRPKAAMMYALLEFLNSKLSNPDEISECYIDEFWSLLKYPMAAEFAEELWRSGRARNNAMVAITQEIIEFLESSQGQVIMRLSASQLILRQQKKTIDILNQFHTFSDSQKGQIVNAQAGEGFVVVEENQIPLYITVSEEEKRLFNTDPKKAKEFLEEEQRRAIAATRAMELPSPTTGGPIRTISAAARAKQILAEDSGDVYVPTAEDYEQRGDERQKGAPAETPAVVESPGLLVPHENDLPAHICAMVGQGASQAGYNLAGLIAKAGKEAGTTVLFVDADGELSDRLLSDITGITPDDVIFSPRTTDIRNFVARDNSSGLSVMSYPEEYEASPHSLVEKAREVFDLVVVVCGWGGYSDGWLAEADAVVAAGEESNEIAEAADRAEALRGSNGTLVATLGDMDLTPELMSRPVFRLTSRDDPDFPDPAESGLFGSLQTPKIGRTFVPLAEELLATRKAMTRPDPDPRILQPAGVGTDVGTDVEENLAQATAYDAPPDTPADTPKVPRGSPPKYPQESSDDSPRGSGATSNANQQATTEQEDE